MVKISVCVAKEGRAQFDQLFYRRGDPYFCAFDLLFLNGDLRSLPLIERKERLRQIIPSQPSRVLLCDYIEARGEKRAKVWYGMFREDIRKPDGHIERHLRKVRLGILTELPTKSAARNCLLEHLRVSSTTADMSFQELTERGEKAEGATMKNSTLSHYQHTLRAYVLAAFGKRKIAAINREEIQNFLTEQAHKYSESSLRSMRVVLALTLGWANDCGWLPKNPCTRIKLPKRTGGRKVVRIVLTPEQVKAIAEKLEEPYATLVLFLAASGLRIGEAVALRWSDLQRASRRAPDFQRRSGRGEIEDLGTLAAGRSRFAGTDEEAGKW